MACPAEARSPSPCERRMERETGFEPATSTLARSHSTTELFPLAERLTYHTPRPGFQVLSSGFCVLVLDSEPRTQNQERGTVRLLHFEGLERPPPATSD